jgi:signal transduction histidine kinase
MPEFLSDLFKGDFLPHGHCYFWQPAILWLNVAADGLIALAYYSIPAILIWFIVRRRDAPFGWMFWMFGGFILACGTTHLMEVLTVWHPVYRLSTVVKLVTAGLSILTAFLLVPVVPRALALPRLETSQRALLEAKAALERSNKDLEQFAYVASHDLQEPLRMIASYTQLLKQRYGDRLDRDAHDFIDFAVDGATRMQRLINDLLAYSRLATRARPFQPTPCGPAVGAALAQLRAAIQESGARVVCDDLPTVAADDAQLTQVFQNLIGNAIKFRGPDPPQIRVSARREGRDWMFSVADNGIGIEPQYSDQIFVMFRRLHTKEYPGSGIGLAICKNIIERHGGRIWFSSERGRGATFHFTLPALEAHPARAPAGERERRETSRAAG